MWLLRLADRKIKIDKKGFRVRF
jgi:hypothetical protein